MKPLRFSNQNKIDKITNNSYSHIRNSIYRNTIIEYRRTHVILKKRNRLTHISIPRWRRRNTRDPEIESSPNLFSSPFLHFFFIFFLLFFFSLSFLLFFFSPSLWSYAPRAALSCFCVDLFIFLGLLLVLLT